METANPKVNKDIVVLKGDVHRLRDDVVRLIHSAKSRSKDTVMETGGRVRGIMTDLGGKVKEQVRDKSEVLKDRGHEAMDKWRGGVEHRPLTALMLAFAAGMVLSFVMSRRRY
jgi:ElaB/YqjD/DUF883 family membrane-anchored ribosome-binding protein